MNQDFEYLADQSILIHHISKHAIFDDVSYLLVLKELITKIEETKPTRLLMVVKSKNLFKITQNFEHWIETQVFPVFHATNITKVAFVINFHYKSQGTPDYANIPDFAYHFFEDTETAREWLNQK